jgi:NitT/TauT family transport system substrate-binding protein
MNQSKRNVHYSVVAGIAMLVVIQCIPSIARAESAKSVQELPELSVSVLQFGTAHWELDHIVHQQLDRKHGYRLAVKLGANLSASHLAVVSGSADAAIADLLWVQSRYQAGSPYLYLPFSTRIGDIVVPESSGINKVADLQGLRIGVAGGPTSKGWVLLQKVASQQGIDLAGSTEVQFAAPPLLSQGLKRGQLDAIVTYWHFAARLTGEQTGEGGWRSAFGMTDLLVAMNLDPNLPVLGYVFPEQWANEHKALVDRFAGSVAEAKAELAARPLAWERLRPLLQNPEPGVFNALRDGFISGNPEPLTDDRVANLRELLVLTGTDAGSLMPERLFYRSQP